MSSNTRSSPFKAKLIKQVIRLIAKLPFTFAQRLGKSLGWVLWVTRSSLCKVAETNIALCFPELSKAQQKAYVRQSLQESVCTFAELPALWTWPKEKLSGLIKHVYKAELMEDVIKQKKGLILALPHLGAWEALQVYLPGRFHGAVMYRSPRIKELDSFIREVRERQGSAKLVPANKYGIKCIVETLNKGEHVIILPDQVPRGQQGVIAPFFGIPTKTMSLLPSLARKTGAVVVYIFVERLKIGEGFAIHFKAAPPEIYSHDKEEALAAMNQGIEACIRQVPTQYQWSYKRFKHADNGVTY